MNTGKVKFFDQTKGFGFISPDDGSNDLFVHVTSLVGINTLETGDQVTYEIVSGKKGPMAGNVSIIDDMSAAA